LARLWVNGRRGFRLCAVVRQTLQVAQLDDVNGVTTRGLVDLITGVSLDAGDVRHSESED
jgi:hypothetical protein